MKRIFVFLLMSLIYNVIFSQTPQGFQYQAVVRDVNGIVLTNQSVSFKISLISGTLPGTIEYVENHTVSTNSFGIVTLNIGSGTPVTNLFSDIDWTISPHYIKVEVDLGSGYLDMGTTQLLSVPYALNSKTAVTITGEINSSNIENGTIIAEDVNLSSIQARISGSAPFGSYISQINSDGSIVTNTDANTIYSAGTGINVTGTVITNTSPDQAITLNNGTGVNVTGTYPSFTINNSSPNATHTGDVTGSSALTISNNAVTTAKILDGNVTASKLNSMSANNGQVLKFNGTSWAPAIDLNAGNPGGLNKTIQFNNSGVFGGDTAMIWDNTNKRLGVGITNPNGRFIIRGNPTAPLTEPLFEVKNAAGQTVFVVYPDSVHVFVKKGNGAKSNNGGFAVSGRSNTKALVDNYLTVTPDSTRIFTGDTISGFGVENLGTGSSTSYMHLTPSNYFIGHQSGDSITSGIYNSFFGYQCGISNKSGNYNVFSGYKSGYSNKVGNYNTFLGYKSGKSNTGSDNTFMGYEAGGTHVGGGGNVFIGSKAGQYDTNGQQNIFIGESSGANNITGSQNIFMGFSSGYNNNGSFNVSLGSESGYSNTYGSHNTFLGYQSGRNNINGSSNVLMGYQSGFNNNGGSNVLLGYQSGFNNSSGGSNVMIGTMSGFNNTSGFVNTFIGETAGYSNTEGTNNVFIGYQCGYHNTTSSGNLFMGRQTGYNNLTGWGNLFLGNYAGYMNTTGSNNVLLGYNAGMNSLGDNNVSIGPSANEHNANGINNVCIGASAGVWSAGGYNVFIGYQAGYDEVGSDKLYIENSSTKVSPLINGDFTANRLAVNRQADTYPFQVGTDASNGNAAYLTTGGTWTSTSSKSLKDRFSTIDKGDLLSKIENLEIKGWFYKETQEYHIGPFAEDFYNAFGTGVLNEPTMLGKSLAASDVAGVSLLAVQELIKQIESLKAEVDQLKTIINNSGK